MGDTAFPGLPKVLDTSPENEEEKYLVRLRQRKDIPSRIGYARFLAELTDRSKEACDMFEAIIRELTDDLEDSECSYPEVKRRQLTDSAAWCAVAYESQKCYDQAEANFQLALDYNPSHALALGNYAMFMHKIRRKKGEASKLFQQAITAHPKHPAILVKFASFKKFCGDLDGAERLFEAALDVSRPDDAEASGAYAVFLHAVRQDAPRAEAMYERAIQADDSHANNLSNFGLFLSDVKRDFERAEAMYHRALEAEPNHANAIYNFAVLLDSSLKDSVRAEEMYRRVLAVDSSHAFALYNLAVLLEERSYAQVKNGQDSKEGWKDEVLKLYKSAVLAAPRDSLSRADLGRFLLVQVKDIEEAEEQLAAALQLDPSSTVALYHMGLLFADKKKDLEKAAGFWHTLVEVDPKHINGHRRLARLAIASDDYRAADEHFKAALQASKGDSDICQEVISAMANSPPNISLSRTLANQYKRRVSR